jgi:hypothetical protein
VRQIVTTDLDGAALKCPCGLDQSDHVHPIAVRVNRGCEITSFTTHGTKITTGSPRGRGVCVELAFDGECGHRFIVVLSFHKGETILEAPPHDGGAAMASRRSPFLATIWRD